MNQEQNQRTALLLGQKKINRLRDSHILIVGLGGVGGMAMEMLARSGVGYFTLVDGDKVSGSNVNRQILAFSDNVGNTKVEEAKKRILRINPDAKVEVNATYLEAEDIPFLFEEKSYHFVLDCIDTVAPKVALLAECYKRKIPVISSMGAGAKLDPSRIKISDISKTSYCSLARVVRRGLKTQGIKKGIPVVYSSEEAIKSAVELGSQDKGKRTTVGTISYLPNLFGCFVAAYALENL